MEVRLTRISRGPDMSQYLTSPNTISCLHLQAAWRQVHVISKLAATEIERDRVAGNSLERNGYGRMKCFAMSGDVIRKSISRRENPAIRDGQHRLTVRVVGVHISRIAGKRDPVLNPLPVDRIAPRIHRLST